MRSRKEKLTVRGVSGTGPELCKHFGIVSWNTAKNRKWRDPSLSWEAAITTPHKRNLEVSAGGMKGPAKLLCRHFKAATYSTALQRRQRDPTLSWSEAITAAPRSLAKPKGPVGEVLGVRGTVYALCKHFGIVDYRTASGRLRNNPTMSWEDAVTRPPRTKRKQPHGETL